MRILKPSNQPTDNADVKGQDIDQVNSEITEIMKLEKKFSEESNTDRQIAISVQLINKYIRAIKFVAIRDKRDLKSDEKIGMCEKLHAEFLRTTIDDVSVSPDSFDGDYVNQIVAGWSPANPTIVQSEQLGEVFREMGAFARIRLLLKLSKIGQQLSEMLSEEFDLHRDMAHDRPDLKTFKTVK